MDGKWRNGSREYEEFFSFSTKDKKDMGLLPKELQIKKACF